MARWMFVLAVMGAVGVSAAAQDALRVKQVVAAPGDIEEGLVALPEPADLGVGSRTLLVRIGADQADERGVVDLSFPFALGDGRARVVFLPEREGAWVGEVTAVTREGGVDAGGAVVRTDGALDRSGAVRGRTALPWGDGGRGYDTLTLPGGLDSMSIRVEMKSRVGGYLLIDPDPDRSLYTCVKERRTLVGRRVTLSGSLSDGSRIGSISALVRAPDGSSELIEAGVDERDVSFVPDAPGRYAVQVFAAYTDGENRTVMLSTQHAVVVERARTALGAARVSAGDGMIGIAFDDDERAGRVILAAEVWGGRDGATVPVCWLARVCDARRSLTLDPRWVAESGVDPESLELRNVRVHDVDSFVPVEIVERVALDTGGLAIPEGFGSGTGANTGVGHPAGGPIMVEAPDGFGESTSGVGVSGHRLLLVHGYCSGGNPFPVGQFDGGVAVFSDPESNRSHDAFALEMLAQTQGLKSFGVAAHSQGAMAALHLYTFYFSPMDWARGGARLIQSVGAPYQGTALAGNAAVLGDIFGFGCGVNDDMTYTGSANWLSLIPSANRADVWYWTTSFEDRPFAYDYCNFVTDLLLDDPDDGVIERSAGQLVGATNMGHTEGWCHTTGMRDPAQCTDAARNAQIDAEAKR